MKSYLAGAYGSRVWNLPDGTVIVTQSMPHGDSVSITCPGFKRPVEFPFGGILCEPLADEAPAGWGAPISEANAPLGTIGGGPSHQAWLQAKQNGQFQPAFTVKRYPSIDAGTIQWQGRSKRERVWFKGPPSRYFISEWSRSSNIWTVDNKKIATPGGVLGCAIYREGDGTGHVIAVHDNIVSIKIYMRKSGAWELLGTVSTLTLGADTWLTCCHFSPRGNKAAIVTFQGSVIEITVTYSGISVTRTPRMAYRYRNTRSVTQGVDATRTYFLDDDPDYGSFTGTEHQVVTTETTWTTTLLEVSPDDPATVLSESTTLLWERPICADFDDEGALIVGMLRYEGAPRFYDYDNGDTAATYNAFDFPIEELGPIEDINWWTLDEEGQITGPSHISVAPAVTGNRAPALAVSGTSTVVTTSNNEWEQTEVDPGHTGNGSRDDSWSLSAVSSVDESVMVADLTISIVVGDPEWSRVLFRDQWSVSFESGTSDVSAGSFNATATDTDASGSADSYACSAAKSATFARTELSGQTIDIFAGRIRFFDLRTLDFVLDSTERRLTNVQDGFNIDHSYDLSGAGAGPSPGLFSSAGILGTYVETSERTITGAARVNQTFQVLIDGEPADTVYRFDPDDPAPTSSNTTITDPPANVLGTAISGSLIYAELAAKGPTGTAPVTTTTVKTASYDARIPVAREDDESTVALYETRALFFAGTSWDGATTFQSPLYLDGELRDAPAIFATSEYTNPRFRDLRSF